MMRSIKSIRLKHTWRWYDVFALAIILLSLFQWTTTFRSYGWTWVKRYVLYNSGLTAFERSALNYLTHDAYKYFKFLDSTLPDGARIANCNDAFGMEPSILIFFLPDHPVVGCRCIDLDQSCRDFLQVPNQAILAIRDFPPASALENTKTFILFTDTEDIYKGVYIPAGMSPPGGGATGEQQNLYPFPAVVIDLFIITAVIFLGWRIASLVLPLESRRLLLGMAFPLGAGFLTFAVFLAGWPGAPITLWTFLTAYVLLLAATLVLGKILRRRKNASGNNGLETAEAPGYRQIDWPSGFALLMTLGILITILAVSVTQSYVLFDDITIWALKGYGIARHGSLYAGQALGGHGLAYPLNYSLMVSLFKLADGDVLPGSKVQNPLYLASMLVSGYFILRKWRVNPLLAASGVLFITTLGEIYRYSFSGFSNITFTANLVTGSLWTITGLSNRQNRYILIGGIFLALAGWTRSEGLFFAVMVLAGIALARLAARRRPFASWLSFLPLAAIPGVWMLFARRYIAEDQVGGALRGILAQAAGGKLDLEPLRRILTYWGERLGSWDAWGSYVEVIIILAIAASAISVFLAVKGKRITGADLRLQLLSAVLVCTAMPVLLFFVAYPTEKVGFTTFLEVLMDRTSFPAVISGILLVLAWLGQAEHSLTE